jgi:hypothetical protein
VDVVAEAGARFDVARQKFFGHRHCRTNHYPELCWQEKSP